MVLPSESFAIYADCEIVYNGRAASTLKRGHYLIVHKIDGTLLIHGGDLFNPRNYLPPKSRFTVERRGEFDFLIGTSKNGKETLEIKLYSIDQMVSMPNWSKHRIDLQRTESDLSKLIVGNPLKYVGFNPTETHLEYKTSYGPIDIALMADDGLHVIEVKRNKITVNDCTQLLKYVEALRERDLPIHGYVAAPRITATGEEYCKLHNLKYIQVNFE